MAFSDRQNYAQRLRDAGTMDEMSYFLVGLTPEGRGAVDNGSGIASLIEVARRLSESPPDGTIRIVFFDREEEGLIGSSAFVSSHSTDLPPLYLNLDMCGYGDTMMVGPTTGADESLLAWIRTTASDIDQVIAEFPMLPGGSDHESFLDVDVSAISLSMVSATDVMLLEQLLAEDFSQLAPILQIIHTQDDYLHHIEPRSLVDCADFVHALVGSL